MNDDEQVERRSDRRWNMFKETLGTFFGVSPYVVAVVIWGSSVNERLRVAEVRIDYNATARVAAEQRADAQRTELIGKLERIAAQIEILQQTVAATRTKQ